MHTDIYPTGRGHNSLPEEPVLITGGWAIIEFGGKPVALIGRGDYIGRNLLETPAEYAALGPLTTEHAPLFQDTYRRTLQKVLLRQAARLSARAVVRMADLFLEMSEKANEEEEAIIHLSITQARLGLLLGMTPVHAHRVVNELLASGIAAHRKGGIQILDRVRLAEVAAGIYG